VFIGDGAKVRIDLLQIPNTEPIFEDL